MYKATVIITNYNQGQFLKRSYSSAITQSYKDDYEIIIVDDGSTDDSLEIANQLIEKSHIPTKLISKNNGGTASARNAGILASESDILCFLDADDKYEFEKIEESVKKLKDNKHIGAVYTDYFEYFVTENKKKIVYKPSFDRELLLNNCIVSTNTCVNKHVFETIGLFDESVKGCEDYDIWLRIAFSKYMILHIPKPLFTYYNHNESKTNTFDKNKWIKEEQRIKERILKGEYYVSNTV